MSGAAGVVGDAVAAAAAELDAARPPADQLTMFTVPTKFAGDQAAELQRDLAARRDRGRPPGSENKATADFRKYLLSRGKSPLQCLMEWSLHTPQSLAKELGCTSFEAFGLLVQVWRELAPYLHSRLAQSDDAGKVVPFLNLTLGAYASAGADLPPWAYLEQTQQNQALSSDPPAVSHGPVSHEADK